MTGNIQQTVNRPARLDPGELQRFVDALARGEIIQPIGVKVGQSVAVMAGLFASFPAVVEEILSGDRVRATVSISGRPSPVELDLANVQTIQHARHEVTELNTYPLKTATYLTVKIKNVAECMPVLCYRQTT